MNTTPIYNWVNDNNPDPRLSYGKGWWDCIEFAYRLAQTYPDCEMSVIETYEMKTPPPTELLVMPILWFRLPHAEVTMKNDFSLIAPFWTASVLRSSSQRIHLYDLVDSNKPPDERALSAFPETWRFGCYKSDPSRFSCQIEDEFALFTFIWILAHQQQSALHESQSSSKEPNQ